MMCFPDGVTALLVQSPASTVVPGVEGVLMRKSIAKTGVGKADDIRSVRQSTHSATRTTPAP
jgi:hypothetical protein